ncbi:MAG: pantoate--beta-alanine ligase [Succinivibrionaceae bacterium]
MEVIQDIENVVKAVNQLKDAGEKIALVPTMGNLHDGHISLVKEALKYARKVVVSIFVNPLQFNNQNDLQTYPRTLRQDLEKLKEAGVAIVFTPTPEVMYPQGLDNQTFVEVPGISSRLEGALRPGHFRGVATVVNKLFNIVRPDYAMFGQKDFQQVAMLRQMIRDLSLQITLVEVPIVRDEKGLALSSRNGLLTEENKSRAHLLHREMMYLSEKIKNGDRDFAKLKQETWKNLDNCGFKTDAVDIVDADTLLEISPKTRKAVILLAAYLGTPRLIDNTTVDL